MDFIKNVSRTIKEFDVVWVLVDCLTKSGHFIAIKERSSPEKLDDIYIFLSDLSSRCANFYSFGSRHLVYFQVLKDIPCGFGTRLHFIITYHPKTDG